MSRAPSTPEPLLDPFEPTSPPPHGQSSAYAPVPTTPNSGSEHGGSSPAPTSEANRARFVSSPLNPKAVTPDRVQSPSGGGRTRPSSWGSSFMLDRPPSDTSSGSHGEKDQMKGVMNGAIGGGFSPYPNLNNANTSPGVTLDAPARPFRGHLGPGGTRHSSRFSTASSVGSLLSFASDSKYAYSHTGSTAAFLPLKGDADPRMSSFLPADEYGEFERLGGPREEDDYMHEPDSRNVEVKGANWRGLGNVALLAVVVVALLMLFAGYPIITHFTSDQSWKNARINGTGQIPDLINFPSLIDPKTPSDQMSRKGFDGEDYVLVFSDEFETDGRSFYPGDDPFWEAVDLHYWQTGDLQWYDPGQVTTRDGKLVIVMEEQEEHGLYFKSGMLQSWNKFCFTTGYIEVSVIFPGHSDTSGYWPGAWIMGNLGRPGYGATTDGLWPYSYDSCDVGTLPNQTRSDGTPTAAATAGGNAKYNNNISWLPGQRLSACTCPGEDHPGPNVKTKPPGRGVPEIDIFEAQKNKEAYGGRVTQSAQMAPFSTLYYFPNTTSDIHIRDPSKTKLNSYRGSALQQAVSALTDLNDTTFARDGATLTKFGFEYWSNPDNRKEGFIDWVADQEVFKAEASTFSGDPNLEISDRLVTEEPMSIILNMAISESFQRVDLAAMTFPAEFKVDYVRVWQRKGLKDALTCDPPHHPTADFINNHPNVYSNPNWTSWTGAGYTWPKNSLKDGPC